MLPTLSDIQLVKYSYVAGDRILAKTSCNITHAQNHRIERAVKKMAGEHVRVLVVNVNKVKLLKIRNRETEILAGDKRRFQRPKVGKFLLDCSAIDFQKDDKLVALLPYKVDGIQRAAIISRLKEWTGPDVEIIITKAVDIEPSELQQNS